MTTEEAERQRAEANKFFSTGRALAAVTAILFLQHFFFYISDCATLLLCIFITYAFIIYCTTLLKIQHDKQGCVKLTDRKIIDASSKERNISKITNITVNNQIFFEQPSPLFDQVDHVI